MKTLLLFSLFSLSAMASEFECRYFQNLQEVYRSTVSVSGRDVKIATLEEYVFFLSELAGGKYELQALNVYGPSRTYAAARLSSSHPEIELIIWKRDAIIEARCTLKSN